MAAPVHRPSAINPQIFLRARVVLPVSQPPVNDGAVLISGGKIVRAGRWRDFPPARRKQTVDLGDAALLPGLVNAHCHLDYTGMAGMFPPQKSFVDWIKLITATKGEWTNTEFAESWLDGARMLVRTGTTTVADFESVPELLPEVWTSTPLRVISFLEMTGVKSRRDPRVILQGAVERIESFPAGRCRAGLAPHAPYSTMPELLRLSAETARRRKWPISVHVAESAQEFEMFMRGRGEMFDWLARNQRDMTDCGQDSPVQHMERSGALSRRLLAVHVNYLVEKDASLLGKRKVSVAHCPRSHAYFCHREFPLRELTKSKVNVCLGTDSLATVYKTPKQTVELNMFEEMRAFAAVHRRISAKTILQMATVNGARALGMAGRAGEISRGAFADLIAVPFTGKLSDTYEAVLHHQGDMAAGMIDGQWTIPPGQIFEF